MGIFYPATEKQGYNNIVPLQKATKYTGFGLVNLVAGESFGASTAKEEIVLVVLSGKCRIEVQDQVYEKVGSRKDVFSGKASGAYVPVHSSYVITAAHGEKVEVAVLSAYAERPFPPFELKPSDVVSEPRGFLNFQREVHNVVIENFEGRVDNIVVGETVVVPGNWSGYPSHKHDRYAPPDETAMEEIYHFRFKPAEGFGLQVIYNDDLSIRESYFLKDGDSVFIPEAYHPIVAAPGFQLYYLWVMGGPYGRTLIPFDDPKLGWLNNVKPLLK